MKTAQKRLGLLIRALAVAVLLHVIGGCAGNRYSQSTGEYLDDSAITAKVKAALVADKDVKARDVQLSGFVDNDVEKWKAEEIAREVKSVSVVENKITVK